MNADLNATEYSLEEATALLDRSILIFGREAMDKRDYQELIDLVVNFGFAGLVLACNQMVHTNPINETTRATMDTIWEPYFKREPLENERAKYEDYLRFLGQRGGQLLIRKIKLSKQLRDEAKIARDSKQLDVSQALLERAINEGLPTWEVWHDHGLSFHWQNQYAEAIPSYKKAIEQNANDHNWVHSCEELRDCYDNLGKQNSFQYEEGIKYLKSVVQLYPQRWIALHEIAYLYWQKGDLKEAMQYYNKAVEQKNDESWGWSSRDIFSCYMAMPDSGEAFNFFTQLTRKEPFTYFLELTLRHPRDWGGWHNLGWWQWNLPEKDTNDAVLSYKKAIELHPSGGWYWSWQDLGWCWDQLGQHNNAYQAFRKCVEFDPENWQAWHGLGSSASHLQNWAEAINAYRRALRLNPESAWSWYGLGNCFQQKENHEFLNAWQAYRQALIIKYDFQEAKGMLQALHDKHRKELKELMVQNFNLEEIKSLCFDMNLNYEELSGESLPARIESLIHYCQRREELISLVQNIRDRRPKLFPLILSD